MKRFALICSMILPLVPAAELPAQDPAKPLAQDVVVYSSGENQQGRVRARGQIVQYSGLQLILRQTSGRDISIPADRVVEIQTRWTQQQLEGDRSFAARKYGDALAHYRAAVSKEDRLWARRAILAQMVWCYRAQDEIEPACREFLKILASDPTTQYFDAIPLSWSSHQPSLSLQRTAQTWLSDSTPAVAKLMGASWLLSVQRTVATQTLRQLTNHTDPRVALLAESQLWRVGVVTANQAEVARWQRLLPRIPQPLRAGPYFLMGQALARQQQHQQAALTLMRVPILYAREYQLSAQALLAAARQLEKIEQRDEAISLYGELVAEYSSTRAAEEAQGRLQALAQQQSK